jgi:hypothetical protein
MTHRRVVAWAPRRNDIQLASDEDWEQEAREAQAYFRKMVYKRAMIRVSKAIRDMTTISQAFGESARAVGVQFERFGREFRKALIDAGRELE